MQEQGDDHAELLKWAAGIGIRDSFSAVSGHTLQIATFPDEGGRGLAAVRDVQQGELLLMVPYSALMGVHSAKQDPHFSKVLQGFNHLSSIQVLTVYLLSEISKARASRWYPYFQHLPRVHHTLAHFSEREAEALQVEDAVWTAKVSRENCRAKWIEATSLLSSLQLKHKFTTFKAWLWASATISSRTLHVPWNEAGVLCPIGDLFNYDAPKESSLFSGGKRLTDGGFDSSTNSYCFYARRNYKKDEQVLLCYGQYTNLELLEHYGFLLQDNPNDVVYIPLPDPEEFGFEGNGDRERQKGPGCFIQATGTPSFCLLEALRLCANPPAKRRSHAYLAAQGLPISQESDLIVFRWLRDKCYSTLKEFSTSIEEDIIILDSLTGLEITSADEKFKLAVEWRLAHKRILKLCQTQCQAKMNSIIEETGSK